MRSSIVFMALLGVFASQPGFAQFFPPALPNNCLLAPLTPQRPDPRDPELTTPEQRCAAADSFALSNVPTTPVDVIYPSGEPRYYCSLDGSTLAVPGELDVTDPELASILPGATPCAGDSVCVDLFGENASCELFGPDATGRGANGWSSLGPASSIAVAGDLDGALGAHSIYVRSPGGKGWIYYFPRGLNRTHSLGAPGLTLTTPGDLPVLDITFCKAESSVVLQLTPPPESECTGFFCRPQECCGPHFPCPDGYPNLSPLLQEPGDRVAGLDLELEALINGDELHDGQGRGMRQLLVIIADSLDSGMLDQACNHIDHFINAIGHNVDNGKLNPDAAGPLEAGAVALQVELGCTVPG